MFPDRPDLRPTGDRLRETLFNWLAPNLPGARCLDLFAGSGALGIEAASRGAKAVVLVEIDAVAVESLRQSRALLAATAIEIVHAEAFDWLQTRNNLQQPFDIVFLDPPFATALVAPAARRLATGNWLAPNALIYIEQAIDRTGDSLPDRWQLHRSASAGQVTCNLYRLV